MDEKEKRYRFINALDEAVTDAEANERDAQYRQDPFYQRYREIVEGLKKAVEIYESIWGKK